MATKRNLTETSPDLCATHNPKRNLTPANMSTSYNTTASDTFSWATFDAKINAALDLKLQNVAKREDVASLRDEVRTLRADNELLRAKLELLERQIERVDKSSRRCNVVVNGLPGRNVEEASMHFTEIANKTLKVNIAIMHATKLPAASSYAFTLASPHLVSNVLKGRKMLKGSSIYIQKDYTTQENKKRYHLRILGNKLKSIGGINVKMGDYSIFVNNMAFTWQDGKIIAKSNTDAAALRKLLVQIGLEDEEILVKTYSSNRVNATINDGMASTSFT